MVAKSYTTTDIETQQNNGMFATYRTYQRVTRSSPASTVVRSHHVPIIFPLPSGKLPQLWKITIFNGKTQHQWPFSIAILT